MGKTKQEVTQKCMKEFFNQPEMLYSSGTDCSEKFLGNNVFFFLCKIAGCDSIEDKNIIIYSSDSLIQKAFDAVITFLPNDGIIPAM